MKRSSLIRLLVGLAIIGLLAYVFRGYAADLKRIPHIPPWTVLVIFLLYLAMRALNGLMMKIALTTLGYVVTFRETVMLAILTTYANLLLPRAGLGLPAVYLKIRRGVNYADFTSQALIITTLQIGCIGILGLAFQGWLSVVGGQRFDVKLALLFAFSLVAGTGASMMKTSMFAGHSGRIANFLHRITEAWSRIGADRRTVLALLWWNVPMLVLRALRLQLAFYAIGSPVPFVGAFIASLVADLLFFISITPAGLGFREAGIIYTSTIMGVTPGVAAVAALLDRLVWMVGIVLVAQFGMWRMIRPALRAARDGAEQPPAETTVASSLESQ
jgi:uncharacterized protein (TIRG00374 family)